MSNSDGTIKYLYEQICKAVDMIERGQKPDYQGYFTFNDEQHFFETQMRCLKAMTSGQLDELMVLDKLLIRGLDLMDEESMYGFHASGFCFNSAGKLTIYNPR